ncbi:MAG: threonine--tRNA ligase [Candidatus Buchananbacteria bacterium RIFCSPHIGHO2_02_FULL_40_13]|uniref:Threonine--tRNA ligase n=1 Tax=Candidatus Buchananbacteria bacterium RIFCSPLOWO2_01_FULL_39_33 TaxID=1797543 RepID=A0A1G1YLN1_9BACT|nr:MAG: threonine--tRNA ligase [Candidatus Buchananbacteria bacterium RIFCSPHIGHO2_01_FULL_40_35]OGY49780.1 MAG: threonine--tRNA ligase [Candidatus Buchananbacteria bacterium RIFCSPHIGHO2_02_FULL_40_13]OGY52726.1 MAG: threonine--tRNA ligase [Candidatus Buchananbacteria bacterium RIFCSPLOWO2_01_FULL_39_33]
MPEAKHNLDKIRHSTSHLLAYAVKEIFGDVKFAIGPTIDEGFYYDFDLGRETFSTDDLEKIEKKMAELIKQKLKFTKTETTIKEALKKTTDQPYKQELIKELQKEGEKKVSFYRVGEFEDLCRGPHVEKTKELGHFKLLKIAGAYWRGDEKNKMLQRIYGTAFNTKDELQKYLIMLQEAEKRDHRKLGAEFKIFIQDDDVGPGLPLWLPNGAVLIEELEKLAKETEKEAGYVRVKTPHICKESMYLKSGHLPYYADSMFPPMEVDGIKYYLKPMNCPHHHKIFGSEPRSYRDLPLRLAEYGTCYRYEQSGELFGLMRVRSMQMNDAHIYCTEDQFEQEFIAVCQMYLKYFKIFGIEKYVMRFSTHSPEGLGKKYVNNAKLWQKTEAMVETALKKNYIPYVKVKNEAAFYGPKIDVQVWSAIGKEFTLATNQVDFAIPARFGLTYKNDRGEEKTPLCIHRAPLGTHERFIGFLIEHYAAAFPLWLAPIQVIIIPVSEKYNDYGNQVLEKMKAADSRAKIDKSDESLGKRIRTAEKQKIPYILVVGEKEQKEKTVAVRKRGEGDQGSKKIQDFISEIKEEIKNKK